MLCSMRAVLAWMMSDPTRQAAHNSKPDQVERKQREETKWQRLP